MPEYYVPKMRSMNTAFMYSTDFEESIIHENRMRKIVPVRCRLICKKPHHKCSAEISRLHQCNPKSHIKSEYISERMPERNLPHSSQ